uniref:Seroin2 n=1 Tax=Samia ricini TaxID=63990 RepID=A0A0M4UT87_SAMRI|nr:seroin2 [Samia ricini]
MNMLPPFPKFKMPVFKPFPRMDPNEIRNHVAGPNEKFSAVSTSSHTFSSNNNGKITAGGGISTIVNDGKKVKESVLVYGD